MTNNLIKTLEIDDNTADDSSLSTYNQKDWQAQAEIIKKKTKNYDLDEMCKQCIKQQYAQGIKDENGNPKLTISCVGLESSRNIRGEEFYNHLKSTQTPEGLDLIEQIDNSLKWMGSNIKDERLFSPRPYQKMIASCSAKRKVLRMGRRCLEANERVEGVNKSYKAKHLWHLYKHHKKMPKIIAFDEKNRKLVETDQYVIVPNGLNLVYKVQTKSGSTTITEEHPLLVYNNSDKEYRYKEVLQLSVNKDHILKTDGELDLITSITQVGIKQTYHLSVIKYETFSTKGGLIHHNTGKALDLRTEIPTPNGWKTMGDLSIGDKVFDNNGDECTVTYATEYQYNRHCYNITFDTKDTIVADADHQWTVYETNIQTRITSRKTVTTQYMVDNRDKNIYTIQPTKAVKYSAKNFRISPYIYGTEIINTFDDKYLYGSIDQRSSLLVGLLQTHNINKNTIEVDVNIYKQVKELLCSLGYKVNISNKGSTVLLTFNTDNIVINDIEEVATRPVKCITVDSPESLYLASRAYVVTHNTFIMTVGMLHRLLAKTGYKGPYRVLMVAPMGTMVAEVYEQIQKFCDALPNNPIVSKKQSPNYEITFDTGATFKGITAGASGAKGARGKGADLLYVDECLPKDAMIKTSERGLLPITDIKVGERILSYDLKKGTTCYRKVTATSNSGIQNVYTYTTLSGRKFRCTSNHPLLTSEGWKEAEKAIDIATIKTRAKKSVYYETIVKKEHTSTEEVYNLAVEGTQNYIADGFVVHNCDFLRPQDLTSILGILLDNKQAEFWVSSTPIGETNLYRLHKDPAFKEFHFPSYVSPEYTQESEDTMRSQMTESGYNQEVQANFGSDDSGVYPIEFLDKYVQDQIENESEREYRTYKELITSNRNRYTLIMGVDWNHDKVGTRIFILALDKHTNLYSIVDKDKVAVEGWTQTKAVEKIVQLNRKYNVDHIYVDEGFGTTQASLLRKYGVEQYGKVPANHPDLKLTKVVAVNFRNTLIIHDPIKGEDLRKQTKQFIVETSVNLLREGSLRLHVNYDSDIINQMKNYVVKSKSASGLVTYTYRDTKIGDHDLDAYNIALFGFSQEYPDYFNMSPVARVSDNVDISNNDSVVMSMSSSIIINTKQSLRNSRFRKGYGKRSFKSRRSW